MRAQKPSYLTAVTWPLIFVLFWLARFGYIRKFFTHGSPAALRTRQGRCRAPTFNLSFAITNEQHVTANVQVADHSGGYYLKHRRPDTPRAATPARSLVGIRYIIHTISGGQPGTTLQYALLLNHDALESNTSRLPAANSRGLPQNPISVGSSGINFNYTGNCLPCRRIRFSRKSCFARRTRYPATGSADTQIAGKVR